jgi:quinol monooxygenase YgiN
VYNGSSLGSAPDFPMTDFAAFLRRQRLRNRFHGGTQMFARFLELDIMPEKREEFLRILKKEILPTLRTYNGFFDVVPVKIDSEPTKFYVISLWLDRGEAEKYQRELYPRIYDRLRPLIASPIILKYGRVDETIPKKIAVTG